MTAIIDYGVGNLFSLRCSLAAIGQQAEVTADPAVLDKADRIILPGVGAFGDAADRLRQTGLWQETIRQAQSGKPLLGICLGMQLLLEGSCEYGDHQGLGLIPGRIQSIAADMPAGFDLKVNAVQRLDTGECFGNSDHFQQSILLHVAFPPLQK